MSMRLLPFLEVSAIYQLNKPNWKENFELIASI